MLYSRPAAAAVIALGLSGVGVTAQQIVDEVAVVVNDDIILKSDIENRIQMVAASLREQQIQGAEAQRALADAEANVVRDLIDEALLLQKAEEYDIDPTVAVLQQMDSLREDVGLETMDELYQAIEAQGDSVQEFEEAIATQYLTQQVLNQEVVFRIQITTEELRARYDAELESWDRPEGVAIQEIVFGKEGRDIAEVRQRAEEVLLRARDGEDFQRLAFEESESPTSRSGGDIGYVARGSLREEYEAVAYDLRRNQISEIIELPNALAIIRLVERHEGGLLPFALAREDIGLTIQEERSPAAIREYLRELRRESFIELQDGYVDSGAVEDPTAAAP